MRPTEYPLRQRRPRDSGTVPTGTVPTGTVPTGTVPIGPAMTTMRSVIARLASVVRSAGIAYVAVQVALWPSFYAADPWRLAGPVAVSAWGAVVTVYLRRTWPAPVFACLDSAVYLALALAAEGCVPPAVRDHAYSWLVIVMSSQLIVPAWYAPAVLSVPLALASPAAYLIGVAWIPGTGSRMMTATAILLIMVAGIHSYGRRTLYRRAATADAALDEADRNAREQYVILSRNIERREHERLLHDTVLNTLTALARAGPWEPGDGDDVAGAVSRCRQDVVLIEAALRDPDPCGSAAGPGDLVHGVRGVAAEMRARGLDVHVEVTGGVPAIPAPVVTALSNATREALSNVAAHARTADAWVEVRRIGPDGNAGAGQGGAGQPGAGQGGAGQPGAQVTVRDQGAGFDLARVDRARLGLRRSITERVADCGGQAFVWSAPGQGTVIRMSWPEPGAGTRGALASAALTSATESSPW
jgi:signal transduction histidine kinase